MKGTVTLENGQVIEIEINEEQLKQMQVKPIKTGYERVGVNEEYYVVKTDNSIKVSGEDRYFADDKLYENANYYNDMIVAENNARADKLFRQLRRFVVENRRKELSWGSCDFKYIICYKADFNEVSYYMQDAYKIFGTIYFDAEETVKLAIETFNDELTWYFTEYKDSL